MDFECVENPSMGSIYSFEELNLTGVTICEQVPGVVFIKQTHQFKTNMFSPHPQANRLHHFAQTHLE